MPLYDFKCPTCGLAFEVSRPISKATEPVSCPNDGSVATRVFTMPVAFVKGGTTGSGDAAGGETSTPSFGHDHGHGHSHGPGGHVH